MQYTRNIKQIIKSFIFGAVLTVLFLPLASYAQTPTGDEAVFGGPVVRESTKVALGNPDEKDPRDTAASIINVIFGFLGLLAVSLILYAGYIWMTSQGNPEKIEKAKDILKNTAIGLLIILSAYAIVLFIFRMFFNDGGLNGGGAGGGARGVGIGALGSGIIVSLYPAPNQTDVPRNTGIIVTFREPIMPNTICATTGAVCNGELIATTSIGAGFVPNIRIYLTQNANNCEVADNAFKDKKDLCGKMFDAKVYSTPDNKTFVFKPTEYLGSVSEYTWHTVYLTKNIKKATGQDAFRSYDGLRDISWSFEVSNKLDLEPPRVEPTALYPAPDNLADTEAVSSALVRATSTVTVASNVPVERLASVASVATTTGIDSSATASVNQNCTEEGIKVAVSQSGQQLIYSAKASSTDANLGQGELSSDNKSVTFDVCGLKLTPSPEYGLLGNASGHFWKININKYIEPARLTVGNHVYTASTSYSLSALTFAVGANANTNASNLRTLINDDTDGSAIATVSGNIVVLSAKTFGEEGNDVQLATNQNNSLTITANKLTGGKDADKQVTVRSRRDKPRNSLIQINFSEAMNPLPLTGSSSLVKDYIQVINASTTALASSSPCQNDNQCKSLSCLKAEGVASGLCAGNFLSGVFKLSNQYKTLEFTSNHQCGVNGCGQKIYCLPGDANIKVELVAATLEGCTANSGECATRQPYTKCDNRVPTSFVSTSAIPSLVCQNQVASSTFPINYPVSRLGGNLSPFDGQMDASFNSLDGNRDTSAQGPFDKANSINYFNENSILGVCSGGKASNLACSEENAKIICGLSAGCQNASSLSEASRNGDNYKFTFWTNNEILSGAPVISTLDNIGVKHTGVNLTKPAVLNFNRVMSASSLSSGRVAVPNGATTTEHRLLNMGAFSQAPVGYWGSSEGVDLQPDGEMDTTRAFINHTDFDPSTDYWSEVGSGVTDINQNCYKPSKGPNSGSGICPADQVSPTCCNGTAMNRENCDGQLRNN